MIEIITGEVLMPPLSERRFDKRFENNEWVVVDTHYENKNVFKGRFENVSIACHSLNKKYYRDAYKP